MANKGEFDVVADVLASAEREEEFLSRAKEVTMLLLKNNMARIRGLAILQNQHRVSVSLEYVFDFAPGKKTIDAAIAVRASARSKSSHPL